MRPLPFFIGFVVGVGLSALWFLNAPTQFSFTFSGKNDSSSTASTTTSYRSGAVSVKDQAAGNSVIVESVTVPPPGVWIAVHEVLGKSLGNVLGAARARGPISNLSVPLLRPTESNHTYAIVLYRDDSDDMFDSRIDSLYVDFETGERVTEFFNTTP